MSASDCGRACPTRHGSLLPAPCLSCTHRHASVGTLRNLAPKSPHRSLIALPKSQRRHPKSPRQPEPAPQNSIDPAQHPIPRPRSVQPSFYVGYAPQKLLLRLLALASLDLACRDHRPDFSATFTTNAFDDSSLQWLGISDLIAEPEGPSFISRTVTHRRVDRRYS